MKWFLIGLVGLACTATWVRGDAAGDLFKQGTDALASEQYDVAAKDFDQIIKGYPNTPNIDDVRLRLGFAYLHTGDFAGAVSTLAKETLSVTKPEFRGTALYFTALAQFSQGQKLTDKAGIDKSMSDAAATLTTLITYITANPTPENRDYMEDAVYYRALAQYSRADYPDAEKDLLQLLQPPFTTSLKKPDYLLLLGSLYAVETNGAVDGKKTPEEIRALAQKALDTFDRVSTDPNALVQANDANMSKAEVLYLIAPLDTGTDGYAKAIAAFHLVRRKDDMIQVQQERLMQLKQQSTNALTNGNGAAYANANSRLIDRETQRLATLQAEEDPIIQALIRVAECYVSMKQSDEARTVLRRLLAHAPLTPDQQKEVDFQLLYSYVLGGQTDKADQALTDFLSKHAGDPQADSISYQIAAKLMERKDYTAALAQADRSLKDFPAGKLVPQVIALKVQALTSLNRVDEANKVSQDFVAANKNSPVGLQLLLSNAQGKVAQGNLAGALDDYKSVRENPNAGPELAAAGAAGYIQTLLALKKFGDAATESQAFAAKYPESKSLPGVLVIGGVAMDQNKDPGAVAALQAVAKKYPTDDASPIALSYVVGIYQRANDVPAMIQAATDLRTAYPTAYTYISQAADSVSAVLIKDKKFDDAIALYQPLVAVSKSDVAAGAQNKIGTIWLAAAKAMGAYQSGNQDTRAESVKRLTAGEQAFVATLKNFPGELEAVGDAFEGLVTAAKQQRSWGILADAGMEAVLAKDTTDLTTPEMQARVEMAKAGLVFIIRGGDKQFPAALDRFKKVIAANPGLQLTRQESNHFGELLIGAGDFPTAITVYTALLNGAAPSDQITLGDALYGLGAAYLAQGNVAKAAENFAKLKQLPGGGAWHPHIQDANFGLALAAEQAGDPQGLAKQTYAAMMQSQPAGIVLQAKAMIGYGRLLEKSGFGVKPSPQGPSENAIHYYQEPHTLFGPAVPEQSAEGLFDAGQTFETAGDTAGAKKQYADLLTNYGKSAPDWAAKAQAAQAKLGP